MLKEFIITLFKALKYQSVTTTVKTTKYVNDKLIAEKEYNITITRLQAIWILILFICFIINLTRFIIKI